MLTDDELAPILKILDVERLPFGLQQEHMYEVIYRAGMEAAAVVCEKLSGDPAWMHPEHEACAEAIRKAANGPQKD